MSAKNVWIAFGLGVSAGAAVALLYAPQNGTKTRKQLKSNIDDGVDYLEDAACYLKEQAEYLSNEAQKTIKRAKTQVEDAVDKVTGVATGAVKSVQALM
ncbi:MAG TPA: YtxH domain-containing protein [Acidobacteriaceae bacterium]|nr:YtxH domain-containing protein [Acidobacteriaceae bacterium]